MARRPATTVTPFIVDAVGAQSIGDPNAALSLIVFSDFQCPFCGQFVRSTYKSIESEFVRTAKVRYVFRYFPLESHPLAKAASVAASCAGAQGRFWQMHDLLFSMDHIIADDTFTAETNMLGLDRRMFLKCQSRGVQLDVERDIKEGQRIGVVSTPTFFIGHNHSDGRIVITKKIRGSVDIKAFEVDLRDALNEREPDLSNLKSIHQVTDINGNR